MQRQGKPRLMCTATHTICSAAWIDLWKASNSNCFGAFDAISLFTPALVVEMPPVNEGC